MPSVHAAYWPRRISRLIKLVQIPFRMTPVIFFLPPHFHQTRGLYDHSLANQQTQDDQTRNRGVHEFYLSLPLLSFCSVFYDNFYDNVSFVNDNILSLKR